MHECMVRLCILLNSLLYICKSELRKSQSGIKGFFFATVSAQALLHGRMLISDTCMRGGAEPASDSACLTENQV